jgi:hypothetical protein
MADLSRVTEAEERVRAECSKQELDKDSAAEFVFERQAHNVSILSNRQDPTAVLEQELVKAQVRIDALVTAFETEYALAKTEMGPKLGLRPAELRLAFLGGARSLKRQAKEIEQALETVERQKAEPKGFRTDQPAPAPLGSI